jgi:hypothetical protein
LLKKNMAIEASSIEESFARQENEEIRDLEGNDY